MSSSVYRKLNARHKRCRVGSEKCNSSSNFFGVTCSAQSMRCLRTLQELQQSRENIPSKELISMILFGDIIIKEALSNDVNYICVVVMETRASNQLD